MKVFIAATAILAILPATLAQNLAPSPTESVGCVPHDDHWHCDGPRTDADENMTDMTTMTTSPATSEAATTTNVEEDHDHDHDDEDHDDHDDGGEMVTLPPSPTESVGCVPHDDHWHCEGPAITEPVEPTTTAEEAGEATTAPAEVDNAVGLVPPLEMLPAAGLFGIFMLAL